MNTTLKIAVAALTIGVVAPAAAQQIDISTITCGDTAAMSTDELMLIVAFIDGFTGGEAGDPVLDVERLNSDLTAVGAACEADPAMTLMDAMQSALAGQ